jgi:hypothetical protein
MYTKVCARPFAKPNIFPVPPSALLALFLKSSTLNVGLMRINASLYTVIRYSIDNCGEKVYYTGISSEALGEKFEPTKLALVAIYGKFGML